MILGWRRYIISFLSVLFLSLMHQPVFGQDVLKNRQVLGSAYLSSSGFVRLGDLFKELPLWNSYSGDGFTHFANNSFSGIDYSRQSWLLYVDGRVVDHGLLGFNDLNTLPFCVNDLDSIEIFHQPTMIEGVWAGNGAIHLHTKRSSGVNVSSEVYLGNEVDDPGPFIYTELEPVNIDRIGPDVTTSLRLGTGDFYSNIHLSFKEHHSTDRAIYYRTSALHDLNNRAPRKILQSTALRMGYQTDQALIEWGLSSSIYDDFPYLLSYGAEVPMTEHLTSAYLKSRYEIGSGFAGFANITRNEDHLKNRFNYLDWDPGIKVSLTRLRAGVEKNVGNGVYQIGIGNDYHTARVWLGSLDDSDYSGRHLFLSAQQEVGVHLFSLHSSLDEYRDAYLPKMMFHWSMYKTDLSLSYSKHSPFEVPHIWYWMDEGYNGFGQLGPTLSGFQGVRPTAFFSASVHQGFTLTSSIQGRILFGLHSHKHDWSIVKNYQYIDGMTRFLGDLELKSDISGARSYAGISLRQKHGNFYQEISYVQLISQHRSSSIYDQATKELPGTKLQYNLHYDVSPGFRFGSLLRLSSATEWNMFNNLDSQITPSFDGIRIPTAVQWDLFAKKTFFSNRIWSTMRIENILDKALREWPIGEVQQMTFHIGLGLTL